MKSQDLLFLVQNIVKIWPRPLTWSQIKKMSAFLIADSYDWPEKCWQLLDAAFTTSKPSENFLIEKTHIGKTKQAFI